MGLLRSSLLLYIIAFFLFSSCSKEEDYVRYIPHDVSSLGKVNVPALKSKALTWDLVYDYLFSSNSEESTDWGVDIDRSIYFYQSSSDHLQILIPLSNSKSFEDAFKKNTESTINKINFPIIDEFSIGWNSNVLILSTQKTFFDDLKLCTNPNQYLQNIIDKEDDLTMRVTPSKFFDDSAYVSVAGNFNTGDFTLDIEGSNYLEKALDSILIPSPIKKNYSFFTDSCIAGLSTNINPYHLDILIKGILPQLDEYSVLHNEQYELIKPYLDGRIYLGVSEIKLQTGVIPEVKISFGLNSNHKKVIDSTFLNNFQKTENGSPYLMNKESSQYLFLGEDFIIFSNHSEENANKEIKNTILNLQLEKSAVNEKLMRLASIFYGKEIVENFPLEGLNIDIHHSKGESIEGELIFDFNNKEDNSLVELINYLYLFQNQDEI